MTLPEVVQGPIAAEFSSNFYVIGAAKKKGDTGKPSCGVTCSRPVGTPDSCPTPKKKKASDFQPMIPAWSEPPAART
jgi:hypothetical protein